MQNSFNWTPFMWIKSVIKYIFLQAMGAKV